MALKKDQLEKATSELYALPLDEFTPARDQLAKQMRGDGDAEGAAAVKQLRKPSVAAWALNQVRHGGKKQADELIDAAADLGETQATLLAGGGREDFDEASARERKLVEALVKRAAKELSAAGRPPSASTEEKLRTTLHAVATSEEARDAFAAGRLSTDFAASGFGAIAAPRGGARPGEGKKAKQKPAEDTGPSPAELRRRATLERKLERARERQAELDEKAEEAERALADSRKEVERAVAACDKAERGFERASSRAQAAGDEVSGLEAQLDEI